MKLRIENQTVRFRLSEKDLELLSVTGRLTETLQITPSSVWSYSIESSTAENVPRVYAETQNMKILLPENELKAWINGRDIEWQFTADKLTVDVEKDLKH